MLSWRNIMIKEYGSVRLFNAEASVPEEWDFSGATHAKVVLDADAATEVEMQRRGFIFADRTLKTSISLARCADDLDKKVRLPLLETKEYKQDILRIACSSFADDRRFHIVPDCSPTLAAFVLEEWVEALDDVLVCLFRDKPVGFLALTQSASDALFVHLAAVEEKYRMTGAAMSLYAGACRLAASRGYKRLEGRISSRNTAVMNVYAAFGASFSEPKDIFLKEVRHDA